MNGTRNIEKLHTGENHVVVWSKDFLCVIVVIACFLDFQANFLILGHSLCSLFIFIDDITVTVVQPPVARGRVHGCRARGGVRVSLT